MQRSRSDPPLVTDDTARDRGSLDDLQRVFTRLLDDAGAQLRRHGFEDRSHEITRELCITWISRLLVAKLLAARPGVELSPGIARFADLDAALTELLARFPSLALTGPTVLERETITLAELDDARLPELLRLLDAHDVAAPGAEATLGLVFERVNAHAHGSFYTPSAITRFMAGEALRRAVVDRFCELPDYRGTSDFAELERRIDRSHRGRREANAILARLRIIDPAVGVGHLLVAALDELLAIKSQLGLLDRQSDIRERRAIIENSLFGIDIDPRAVEICRLRLRLELLRASDRDPPQLEPNIVCADALLEPAFGTDRFDVVLANPPFMSAIEMSRSFAEQRRARLKAEYSSHAGAVDLYILFFELALRLLRPGGHAAMITPNKFLAARYGQALREHLAKHATIAKVIDYGRVRVFRAASVYPVVSVLRKAPQGQTPVLTGTSRTGAPPERYRSIPASMLDALPNRIWGFLLNDKLELTTTILRQCEPLTAAGSINATSTAAEAAAIHEHIREAGRGFRLINTGTIDPWVSLWADRALRDKGRAFLRPTLARRATCLSPGRRALYGAPKIVLAKTALRVEAYYDDEGRHASINTNCIHSFAPAYEPKYVLGWIHSRLFHYVYTCLFDSTRMNGGYLPFNAPNLRVMGIKRIPTSEQREIAGVVDRILQIKRRDIRLDVTAEERELDELFYRAFALDAAERRAAEAARPPR